MSFDSLGLDASILKAVADQGYTEPTPIQKASIPVITVAAIEISNLLAGAVIVETVFAWPGLGQVTVQSILARDFMVVQGVVLMGAFVTIALNLLADILYSAVDPRIRLDGVRR